MPAVAGGGAAAEPLTALKVTEVAELVRYTPRQIRDMVRAGTFPEPLVPSLKPRSWRWSPLDIAAYNAGEWKPAAA